MYCRASHNRCHYVEVVGQIGAGKSTTLLDMRRCLPLYFPNPHIEVDVEAEDILERFITPLLTDVYRLLPGSERSEELAIEAIFASIRLIQVKAFNVDVEDPFNFKKVLTAYSAHLEEAFSLPSYLDEKSLCSLRESFQFLIARRRAAIHGCELRGVIVDRGLADILCFIRERLNPKKTLMRALFLAVYDEIVQLIYRWSPAGCVPRPQAWEDFVKLGHRFHYTVVYLSIEAEKTEENIIKRGRKCEVDASTGKPLPRVLNTNKRLGKIYSQALPHSQIFSQEGLVKTCLSELGLADYSEDYSTGDDLAFVLPRLLQGIEPFDPEILLNTFVM